MGCEISKILYIYIVIMTKKLTPFLKPNEVLSETEVDYLKEKSDFKGIALLFHAWFIIGLSVLVYSLFPNIFTFLAAVLVIAGRQLGLAILMHEGAHGLITNNTKLNNSSITMDLCFSGVVGYLRIQTLPLSPS